jgi:hypothetical protein
MADLGLTHVALHLFLERQIEVLVRRLVHIVDELLGDAMVLGYCSASIMTELCKLMDDVIP